MLLPSRFPLLIAYNARAFGLGNRVRATLGAQRLAALESRDFCYVWPTGATFGPEFTDLWDFQARTTSRWTSRLLSQVFPYEDDTLDWLNERKRRQPIWQILTGKEIKLPPRTPPWQDSFRALRPVDEIRTTVKKFFDEHLRGETYIGVMIRAHPVSHQVTLQTSPVTWYVDRLREIRRHHPDVKFFLSCDVPDVQAQVMKAIPGSCAQELKGAYNTVAGVRSSIADLYLLASSGYLIGPHFSSFVHLARHLSGDQLTFETAARPQPEVVDLGSAGLAVDPLIPTHRV